LSCSKGLINLVYGLPHSVQTDIFINVNINALNNDDWQSYHSPPSCCACTKYSHSRIHHHCHNSWLVKCAQSPTALLRSRVSQRMASCKNQSYSFRLQVQLRISLCSFRFQEFPFFLSFSRHFPWLPTFLQSVIYELLRPLHLLIY
jgi:hypothetical protein